MKQKQKQTKVFTNQVSLTLIVALAVNSIRIEKTYILFGFPYNHPPPPLVTNKKILMQKGNYVYTLSV